MSARGYVIRCDICGTTFPVEAPVTNADDVRYDLKSQGWWNRRGQHNDARVDFWYCPDCQS